VPLGVPGSWTLSFDDEFTSLNLSNWRPNWLGNSNTAVTQPVNSEEVECIDPAQSTVGGGVLTITAVQRGCAGHSYASGLLETNGHFDFTYGYMEARMFLPSDGAGGIADWPAFWADGANWPNDGEIDVMEGLDGPACWHFHWGTPSAPQQVGGCPRGDFSGWHTYGADWEPGTITWYYDGKKVGRTTSGVTGQPMYLIVNLALTPRPMVPARMSVDYVRVWRH
jgi:beta-glucanase (GH16 family)